MPARPYPQAQIGPLLYGAGLVTSHKCCPLGNRPFVGWARKSVDASPRHMYHSVTVAARDRTNY